MIPLGTLIQKNNLWKTVTFVVILLSFGFLITYKVALPAAEDLPRQIMNGKDIIAGNMGVLYNNAYSYTDPAHAFANHHWFYGVFMYGLDLIVGFKGIVVFKIILFLFAFGLLFYTAKKRSDFWLVALFSVPTVIILLGRSAARPEMFSYLFAVLFLYFLSTDTPTSKKIFWIIPIQLLWANIHILFPAGIAIVGAFWLEAVIKNWRGAWQNPLVKKLTLVLALSVAVSFLNPFGINGVLYSLGANTTGATAVFSAEVQSIADVFKVEPRSDYLGAMIFTPLVILLGLSFVVGYKRRNIAYLILTSAFAFLSYKIIRGLPMFAVVFLPAITSNLEDRYQQISQTLRSRWPEITRFLSVVAIVVFIGGVVWGTVLLRQRSAPYQPFGIGVTDTSQEPAQFFKDNLLKGPIFNDTDIGSYLIYHLYPDERVFADNRFADAYSREFLEGEYLAAFTDENRWAELLEKYKFNVIILNHYNRGQGASDFIYNRVYDPQWVWVYAGRDAVIFVRNSSENQAVIDKYIITRDNFVQKMQPLSDAPDYAGQVAAADLFAYTGNVKLAIPQYEKIVSQWPKMGKIWYIIGRTELLRADQPNADTAKALLAIQRAIDLGYKTPYAYSYLALAYYRLGDLEKTEEAVKKEIRINPDLEDAKGWTQIITKEKLRRLDSYDTQ